MELFKDFEEHWKDLLSKPREEVGTFCANLTFFATAEKALLNGTEFGIQIIDEEVYIVDEHEITAPEDIPKHHRDDRMLVFIYESIEADLINNKVTKFINGEQFYHCFNAYMDCFQAQRPDDFLPELTKNYSDEEKLEIINNYLVAKTNIQGYINPREVINYFYFSAGREFLPLSLVAYYEKENGINPPKDSSSASNRSGSKINPQKHERTRLACIKAWEKVQKEKNLVLNQKEFCKIASTFLGQQGESLNTTVARAFYKNEVNQEYKAGAGRKSK